MNIHEDDLLITGGSMAQDQQALDPLHMSDMVYSSDNDVQNKPYPFTEEEVNIGRLFVKRLGSYERVLKLLDYLERKDDEYMQIAHEQSPIEQIAADMTDDHDSLAMQDYMNSATNPGADGPY